MMRLLRFADDGHLYPQR